MNESDKIVAAILAAAKMEANNKNRPLELMLPNTRTCCASCKSTNKTNHG